MQTIDPIDEFKRKVERDSLKSSVGRAMFCPRCENLMDWKRAAEFSAWKGDKCASIKVFCSDCADRVRPTIEAKLADLGLRLEVIDGRKIK